MELKYFPGNIGHSAFGIVTINGQPIATRDAEILLNNPVMDFLKDNPMETVYYSGRFTSYTFSSDKFKIGFKYKSPNSPSQKFKCTGYIRENAILRNIKTKGVKLQPINKARGWVVIK